MSILVGRETELARCGAVLDSAARRRHVRVLRFVGPTGVGKTALAERGAEIAAEAGWLVVRFSGFRIHSTLPLFSARQVLRALLEALGADASRYRSGIEVECDNPMEFEEAFLRVVEGVTFDRKLLFLLDDAQWIDGESRHLFAQVLGALADRPIVLTYTERSGELTEPALSLSDESIALDDLSPAAALLVVRNLYQDVTDDVAQAIVAATRGHAVDLVAVTSSARDIGARTIGDVADSTRRVVARDLAFLDPSVRTFLQLCALIEEPIELSLLAELWPQAELAELIGAASPRYLIAQGAELRFVHSTIMESILETIPIAIPLRHRIIQALQRLPATRLADLERLASQARFCGDRRLERDTLLKTADVAERSSMWSLAADAIERAIEILPLDREAIVPTLTRLSTLNNVLGREFETIQACQQGMRLAEAAGIKSGTGALGASLILALWNAGRTQDALDELDLREQTAIDPADRAQILSAGLFVAMNRNDKAGFARMQTELEQLLDSTPPFVKLRARIMQAFVALRSGNEAGAAESLRVAERLAEALPPMALSMPRAVRGMLQFRYRSVLTAKQHLSHLERPTQDGTYLLLHPQVLLARGELSDAIEYCHERLESERATLFRRLLLGPLATALAMEGRPPSDPLWLPIVSEASRFEGQRDMSSMVWPVLAGLAFMQVTIAPNRATAIAEQLARWNGMEIDVGAFPYLIVLANTARALDHRALLQRIAAGEVLAADPQPWNQAQWYLGRAVAAAALDLGARSDYAAAAAERFDALEASFWAAQARTLQATSSVAKPVFKRRTDNTTRREREIAALVADGLTNRQIAEKLVLSERTVEGHIANLFAKLNVNSRTQLTAWFIRTTSSVA